MSMYRATYIGKGKSFSMDIEANDDSEALVLAMEFGREKGLRYRGYDEVSVSEIPKGATVIGIEFEYYDRVFKDNMVEYMLIFADSEAQAHNYYNEHFRGHNFSGQNGIGKIDENGKCRYGRVFETYYASCNGYHVNIAKGGKLV